MLLSVNAACAGYRPVPEFDPGDLPRPAALAGTPLTRLWRVRPLSGPSAPAASDGQTLFLGGSSRKVIALDLGTGRTRWSHRVAGPMLGGVLAADSMVYAGTARPEGKVHAFEAISGNERWSTGIGEVEAPMALVGHRLLALTRQGRLIALDRRSGKVLWRTRLAGQRVGPVPLPGGEVLVTGYDSLYLVNPADGKIRLRRPAPGQVVSPWVTLGSHLVAGTGDSMVVALDPESLATAWQVRLDAPVLSSPAVRGDTAWAVTITGSVYRITAGAVDSLRGEPWAVTGAPAVVGDWLLVGGSEGALRAFALSDGAVAWSVKLGRPLELAPLRLAPGEFLALGGPGDVSRFRVDTP